ncbi:MAG: FtsX-like permease family protein [Bacteroidota bacterium]
MNTLIKLAWRNIWRNKRRTLITAASILFAVLFASLMESLQKGIWEQMVNNVVGFYYGFAQVHKNGYWDEQTIDNSFEWTPQLAALPDKIPQLDAVVPRIESFALASYGNTTLGALVIGTNVEAEDQMTGLSGRMLPGGRYLRPDDRGILIAEGLAENLQLQTGDTLVLISQGYRGVNAAGKYPVRGLINFGSPELNKQMVYLPLAEAQWFYGAESRITSLALQIEQQEAVPDILQALKAELDEEAYEIMSWEELLPDIVKARELDAAGNYIVYAILYLIIAFGIFGTILMMSKERSREFGILTAIGMRRGKLAFTVWLETVILGLVGALAGILVSVPIVWYFNANPVRLDSGTYADTLDNFGFEPIFPTLLRADIFFTQALIIFIITSLLALYPMLKIRRLQPVAAMRE